MALLALVAGPSPWAIVWAQAALDSLTAGLIAWLGFQLGPRTGIAAGALAACWPNMIITSALVLNDTLFLLLFTAMLAACVQLARRPGMGWVAAAALLFGLSLMVRPLFQFVIPVMAVATAAAALRAGASRLKAVGLAALFVGLSLAPAAPLIARNLVLYDTPALTAQSGTHLLGWIVPLVSWHTEGVAFDTAFREARAAFEADLEARGQSIEAMGSFATSQARTAFALEWLRERPVTDIAVAWIKGAVLNLGAPAITSDPRIRAARQGGLLEDGSGASDENASGWIERLGAWAVTDSPWATGAILLGLAGSAAASLLQAAGIFRLGRRAPWALAAGLALIAYVLLIMGPVAGTEYRLPAAPVLIVLTACGGLMLYDWLSRAVFGRRPAGPTDAG